MIISLLVLALSAALPILFLDLAWHQSLSHATTWMWLIAAFVMFANAAMQKNLKTRRIAVVLASLALAMIIVEVGFSMYAKAHPTAKVIYDKPFAPNGFHTLVPSLGYEPVRSARVHARKLKNDRVVYDARYTLDSVGRRLTIGNPLGPTVIFTGCSYTFGEGVTTTRRYRRIFQKRWANS